MALVPSYSGSLPACAIPQFPCQACQHSSPLFTPTQHALLPGWLPTIVLGVFLGVFSSQALLSLPLLGGVCLMPGQMGLLEAVASTPHASTACRNSHIYGAYLLTQPASSVGIWTFAGIAACVSEGCNCNTTFSNHAGAGGLHMSAG